MSRRGRHAVLAIAAAFLAVHPGGAKADTLCEDGWVSPSDGGPGTCSWHGGIAGNDNDDGGYYGEPSPGRPYEGGGYYPLYTSEEDNDGSWVPVVFWTIVIGGVLLVRANDRK